MEDTVESHGQIEIGTIVPTLILPPLSAKLLITPIWACSSVVEHGTYNPRVDGSIPSTPTIGTNLYKLKVKKLSPPIPIILVAESSIPSYTIFNPNNWGDNSKHIIQTCAVQYGLLKYTCKELDLLIKKSENLCRPSITLLNEQWRNAKWPFKNCLYFVEVPELHLKISAFLGAGKSFLDVLVQLIGTEQIVSNKINGFHKSQSGGQDIIGGQTLQMLNNNVVSSKKDVANNLRDLLNSHKKDWIDTLVISRDTLTHPKKGFNQVMFELKIRKNGGNLELKKIKKPKLGEIDFNQYASETLNKIELFSKEFIKLVQN